MNGNGKNGNGNGEKTLQPIRQAHGEQVQDKPKYKFLFVSHESLSGDLAWKVQNGGHQVKCWIEDATDEYDGFLEKVGGHWKDHVDWADVIVFDDTGFGKEADTLRKVGKAVVGGS